MLEPCRGVCRCRSVLSGIPVCAVAQALTTIANKELESLEENGITVVPDSLQDGGELLEFAADNTDEKLATLDGESFHGTQRFAVQHVPCTWRDEQRAAKADSLVIGQARSLVKVPEGLHATLAMPKQPDKHQKPPVYPLELFKRVARYASSDDITIANPDWGGNPTAASDESDVSNLVHQLVKMREPQSVPSWKGFNQAIRPVVQDAMVPIIAVLPLLHQIAHEPDTVWTNLMAFLHIQDCKAKEPGSSVPVTWDQNIYYVAQQVKWANPERLKRIFNRLGSLHICKAYFGRLGACLSGSGADDLVTDGDVYGDNTTEVALAGGHIARADRLHHLLETAVFQHIWDTFEQEQDGGGWEEGTITFNQVNVAEKIDELAASLRADPRATHESTYAEAFDAVKAATVLQRLEDHWATLSPSLKYWVKYLKLLKPLRRFDRSEKTGNFNLYKQSLIEMEEVFAGLDATNYQKWLADYILGLANLEVTHPDLYAKYQAGRFVIKRNPLTFTAIGVDWALEHVNSIESLPGGCIGIRHRENVLNRWCLTHWTVAKRVEETIEMITPVVRVEQDDSQECETRGQHADRGQARIKRDARDVAKLVSSLKKFDVGGDGGDGQHMLTVATKDVIPEETFDGLMAVLDTGAAKAKGIFGRRFDKTFHTGGTKTGLKVLWSDPISNASIPRCADIYKEIRTKSKDAIKYKKVKNERDYLHRLFIAMSQGRDVNAKEIVSTHELSEVPESLTRFGGELATPSSKAALTLVSSLKFLPAAAPGSKVFGIIDGNAMLQEIQRPPNVSTWGEYADVVVKVVKQRSKNLGRLYIGWDRYWPTAIKDGTRAKRKGKQRKQIRTKIQRDDQGLPRWKTFIHDKANKTELVAYVARKVHEASLADPGVPVVQSGGGVADDDTAVHCSDSAIDTQGLASDHEEMDTRCFTLSAHAKRDGAKRVVVWCRDTDVRVMAVYFCSGDRAASQPTEFFMKTGTRKSPSWFPAHDPGNELSEKVKSNLPGYHAGTGCDTTGGFVDHPKHALFKVYTSMPEALDGLGRGELTDAKIEAFERFVCQGYAPGTECVRVEDLRWEMFNAGKSVSCELPPTVDALTQHLLRCHYQAKMWYLATVPMARAQYGDIAKHGWTVKGGGGGQACEAVLMTKPGTPSQFLGLVSCGCKAGKCAEGKKCSCRKAKMACTSLCKHCHATGGKCENRSVEAHSQEGTGGGSTTTTAGGAGASDVSTATTAGGAGKRKRKQKGKGKARKKKKKKKGSRRKSEASSDEDETDLEEGAGAAVPGGGGAKEKTAAAPRQSGDDLKWYPEGHPQVAMLCEGDGRHYPTGHNRVDEEFDPMDVTSETAQGVVGLPIEVWWAAEREWYPGTVSEWDFTQGIAAPACVEYDDGEVTWYDLDDLNWRFTPAR